MASQGLSRGRLPLGALSLRSLFLLFVLVALRVAAPSHALALAAGAQVTVMYPVNGTLTSSPLQNPPHHHYWGNFSVDDASGAGSPVYARFANASGALSLSVGGTFEPCAAAGTGGSGVIINVSLDGQAIGSVYYAHLTAITQTSGAITNGSQIGVHYSGAYTSCWQGAHTHVEPKGFNGPACFVSRALSTPVDGNAALGVIGSGYATGDNQTCPAGAENGGSPPPPADQDGDGVPDASDHCPTVAGDPGQLGCPAPNGVPIDVNGDGKTDLVHRWSQGVNTWISNGDGSYSLHTQQAQSGYGYTDGQWPASVYSMSLIRRARPSAMQVPVISGNAVVGGSLSCSQGTWRNRPTSFSYGWLRGGTVIAGQISSTYTPGSTDGGRHIACQVTATNPAGSAIATSIAVTVPVPPSGGLGSSGNPGSTGGAGSTGGSGGRSPVSSHSRRCTVPNLKHMTLTSARSALRRSHCTLGKVHRPKHIPPHAVRHVTSQSPRSGTNHVANYPVSITMH